MDNPFLRSQTARRAIARFDPSCMATPSELTRLKNAFVFVQ